MGLLHNAMDDKQAVNYKGFIVSYYSVLTIELSCSFDVSDFPFDTQYCPIVMLPQAGFRDVYNISEFLHTFFCLLRDHWGAGGGGFKSDER